MSVRRFTTDQDAFLALVCADEELLRAEFEAIIDACWDRPPPTRPTRWVRPPTRSGAIASRRPAPPRWPYRRDGRGRGQAAFASARPRDAGGTGERRVMS
jgi:hypothetical protein